MIRAVWLCPAAALIIVSSARADSTKSAEPRPLHWAVGAGGFGALTGPASSGPAGVAELYPGGRFGRVGVRGVYRGIDGFDGAAILGGITFEAAAARPRLSIALHGDAGASLVAGETSPVFGGGVQTTLWIWGPVAIAADGTAYLFYDGVDSRLALAQTLTIRLGR